MKTHFSVPITRGVRRATAFAAAVGAALGVAACDDDDPTNSGHGTIAEIAAGTPELATLTAALEAAGLTSVLEGDGPFTVFAPVNAAFDALGGERVGRLLDTDNRALLTKVLTYHIVPGEIRAADLVDGASVAAAEGSTLAFDLDGAARVNGVRIVTTDIEASNGVIHLVEAVLVDHLDLVDVATVEGFGALVGAVQAAGLEATLRSSGGGAGFTVFAPTDAAFAAVGDVPSDSDVLADILLYHVAGGTVLADDLRDGQVIVTAHGGSLTVDLGGGVFLRGSGNDASVLATDVRAANGVIHVLDAVLLP